MKKLFAIAVLVGLSLLGTASAGTVTFDGVNEAKPYSYTIGNTFSVTGLSLQTLFLGSNDYAITGGMLDVSSGAFVGTASLGTTTLVGFNPGGGITITGAVPYLGVTSPTVLLSGTFLGSSATFDPTSGGSFAGALVINYVNPNIFGYGEILSAADAQTILNVKLSTTTPNTFNTEISASHVTLGVPEPGSLALLGLGTLALPMSFRKYIVRR
jgi:hypothetical protein